MHVFLYEKSAVWRGLVQLTKNPKYLGLFVASSIGASYGAGKAVMYLTSGSANETSHLMKEKIRNDPEAARYASFSKKAVSEIIRQAQDKSSLSPQTNDAGQQILLPRTAWHPEAEDDNPGKKPSLKRMW